MTCATCLGQMFDITVIGDVGQRYLCLGCGRQQHLKPEWMPSRHPLIELDRHLRLLTLST